MKTYFKLILTQIQRATSLMNQKISKQMIIFLFVKVQERNTTQNVSIFNFIARSQSLKGQGFLERGVVKNFSKVNKKMGDFCENKMEQSVSNKKAKDCSSQYRDEDEKKPENQKAVEKEGEEEIESQYLSKNESFLYSPFKKVNTQIAKGDNFTFELKRNREWLNKLKPEFHLYLQKNHQYIMSAKLISSKTTTTFLASLYHNEFVENGLGYLGKIKINFIGNIVNIYGPGFKKIDAKEKKASPRELLATIQYEEGLFSSAKSRDFKVYFLRPGVKYCDLKGTKAKQEVFLNQLFCRPENKKKILFLTSKKIYWNKKESKNISVFSDMAKVACAKNFILEDPTIIEEEREVMIFGKIKEDNYKINVKYPLTPYVGFGIALSVFGTKLGFK